jgi:hypothetical protein
MISDQPPGAGPLPKLGAAMTNDAKSSANASGMKYMAATTGPLGRGLRTSSTHFWPRMPDGTTEQTMTLEP